MQALMALRKEKIKQSMGHNTLAEGSELWLPWMLSSQYWNRSGRILSSLSPQLNLALCKSHTNEDNKNDKFLMLNLMNNPTSYEASLGQPVQMILILIFFIIFDYCVWYVCRCGCATEHMEVRIKLNFSEIILNG